MKSLLFFLLLAGISFGVFAQQTATGGKPESLSMKETSFDFGKIQQSHPVTHDFEINNSSPDTLKIADVKASCGCTTPVWKKEPVAPGAGTILTVGYNAASMGTFERTVTIYYNDHQTKTITIKGEVMKAPATAAPQNSSIQLLKQTNQ